MKKGSILGRKLLSPHKQSTVEQKTFSKKTETGSCIQEIMWKLAIASSRLKVVRKSSSLSNVQLFLSLDSTSHNKKQVNKVTFKLSNIYKLVCIKMLVKPFRCRKLLA